MRLDQHPHSDRGRDAAWWLQALRVWQRSVDVRARGLHPDQARHAQHRVLMRILLVGAGGVGSAFAAIAARRDFFEHMVIADYDEARAVRAADVDERFSGARIDASDESSVAALVREHAITHVMNAVDPRLVMPIFTGARPAGPTT